MNILASIVMLLVASCMRPIIWWASMLSVIHEVVLFTLQCHKTIERVFSWVHVLYCSEECAKNDCCRCSRPLAFCWIAGLYFADMFAKSYNYTGGFSRYQRRHVVANEGRLYVLLCEVALGNIETLKPNSHRRYVLWLIGWCWIVLRVCAFSCVKLLMCCILFSFEERWL